VIRQFQIIKLGRRLAKKMPGRIDVRTRQKALNMSDISEQRPECNVEIVRPVNKSFGAAQFAWLKTWSDHLNNKLLLYVAESFNQKQFKRTGELWGFKRWDTLQNKTGLGKVAVWRFFKRAGELGALHIEGGRRDHAKKTRIHNRYRARTPYMDEQTKVSLGKQTKVSLGKSNLSQALEDTGGFSPHYLKEDYLTKYPASQAAPPPSAAPQQGKSMKEGKEEKEGKPLASSDGPLERGESAESTDGGSARRWVTVERDSIQMRALLAHPAREQYARCGGVYAALVPADEWEEIWSAYERQAS
jgi:hypothetical protein